MSKNTETNQSTVKSKASIQIEASITEPQQHRNTRMIHIRPSIFVEKNKPGDYALIPKQKRKLNCLWLHTDTVLCQHNTKIKGGGTACLRPYAYGNINENEQPLSFGILVGWTPRIGAFKHLNDDQLAKLAIDCSFKTLRCMLQKYSHIDTIYYPADTNNIRQLGVGVFAETSNIHTINYISTKIHQLSTLQTNKCENVAQFLVDIFMQRAEQEYANYIQTKKYKEEIKTLKDARTTTTI